MAPINEATWDLLGILHPIVTTVQLLLVPLSHFSSEPEQLYTALISALVKHQFSTRLEQLQ